MWPRSIKMLQNHRICESTQIPFSWQSFPLKVFKSILDKVLKNRPSKICGRQPLKILKEYRMLKQTILLYFFWWLSSTNFTRSILEYFVSFNLAKNLSFLMFPIKPFPNVTFHKSFHKSFHNLFTSHSTNFTWSILEYFVSFNLAKNLSFLVFPIKPFSNVTFL